MVKLISHDRVFNERADGEHLFTVSLCFSSENMEDFEKMDEVVTEVFHASLDKFKGTDHSKTRKTDTKVKPAKAKANKPEAEPEVAPEVSAAPSEPAADPEPAAEVTYTIDEVRAEAKNAAVRNKDAAKDVVNKFADKLSDIPSDRYAEVVTLLKAVK